MKKSWFQDRFLPSMARLGNQRHLATIRDAFAIFTPVIIAGAMAVLWRSVIFSPAGGQGAVSGWWLHFQNFTISQQGIYYKFLTVMSYWMLYVQVGTINVMSLYIAFGVGYFLAQAKNNSTPTICGLTTLACFLSVTSMMISGTWESGMYWLGARGLLTAIIISMICAEFFCFLSKNDRLSIKMPQGVPPAISRAFAKLFPVILTIVLAATINLIVWVPFYFTGIELKEGASLQVNFKRDLVLNKQQFDALVGLGLSSEHFTNVDQALWDQLVAAPDQATFARLIADHSFQGFTAVDPQGDLMGQAIGAFQKGDYTTTLGTKPLTGDVTLTSFIYAMVVAPFLEIASRAGAALGLAILYVFIISFFWFFGLHGANIANGVFNPIWLLLYAQNVSGIQQHVFVQGTFDAFIFIGGSGATLALILATLIFGRKNSSQHQISRLSVAPGIFQINEPVTFGYPLVLNMYLIIPLFITMPILVVTTWVGIGVLKLVTPVKVLIPWTMPIGAGAFIATGGSLWAVLLALVNLLVAMVIYTPFVLILNRRDKLAETQVDAALQTEEGQKFVARQIET